MWPHTRYYKTADITTTSASILYTAATLSISAVLGIAKQLRREEQRIASKMMIMTAPWRSRRAAAASMQQKPASFYSMASQSTLKPAPRPETKPDPVPNGILTRPVNLASDTPVQVIPSPLKLNPRCTLRAGLQRPANQPHLPRPCFIEVLPQS